MFLDDDVVAVDGDAVAADDDDVMMIFWMLLRWLYQDFAVLDDDVATSV